MLEQVLDYLTLVIGIIGIMVIVWGVFSGLIRFIQLEIQKLKGKNICKNREILRQHLGSYLLLGLEFLIAADVIHTITKPSLKEIAILGSIVGIRTILNFFLNKELEGHNCIEN
jgi:uncharacterized membrane protein